LHRYCLLKHVIVGRKEGRIEVTGRRGKKSEQLLNDLKEMTRYWKYKHTHSFYFQQYILLLKTKAVCTDSFRTESTLIYTLPFYFCSFVKSQYSHSNLMQCDQNFCSAGRAAVTDILVSLVGTDVMY
jgi:hypothetical protein